MKRLLYCCAALLIATQLSSCSLLGSLLGSIGRVPGTLLNGVMSVAEAEAEEADPEVIEGEVVPVSPIPVAVEDLVIVPSPMITAP